MWFIFPCENKRIQWSLLSLISCDAKTFYLVFLNIIKWKQVLFLLFFFWVSLENILLILTMYLPVVTFRTMPFIIRGTPAVPQVPFLWITQSKSPFTINKRSYGLTLKTW